ncbi:MAG: cytochrome c oxidase subunit II, partial [Gemmatimonadota bacterium]
EIDTLFWLILVITGIAFILVEVGIVWFMFRYRRRDGQRAHYTHGSQKLEIVWTAVPALVLLFLGIYSGRIWASLRSSSAFPQDALTLGVTAKQFEWNVTYPGADRVLGNSDDFTIRNQFHIPVNEPVVVRLEAEDVIHSFFIPELRVKQDAVPGMTIPIWFDATRAGEYEIGCAELCGLGHYRMRASVTVHEPDAYEAWYREQVAGAAPSAAPAAAGDGAEAGAEDDEGSSSDPADDPRESE